MDNLLEKGHDVTIFDRHTNHDLWKDNPKVKLFLGDIKDQEAVVNAIGVHNAAVNLAGLLGTSETLSTPYHSVEANIIGALNFYEGVKRFNIPAVQITVGNWSWNNTYAISKYTAERFALMYNKEFGLNIAVVRGLNVYGERQKHYPIKKVVPNFVINALANKPIEIYGDGEQLLDLIYVKDTAEILVRALLYKHGVYDKVIEAGSGELITANHLAKTIIELSKSKSNIVHLPMRSGEPIKSITKGDPTTLAPLKYNKMTTLEKGLAKTIEWYRSHMEISNH